MGRCPPRGETAASTIWLKLGVAATTVAGVKN